MKYADNSIFSNPGTPLHTIYKPIVQNDGTVLLEPAGVENTDDFINSFAASTDIRLILQRVNAGEFDLLNKHVGQYGDFTQMPKTYAELLQLQIDSKNLFDSLPVDVKKKFDNDANQFLASSGSLEWFERLEPILNDEVKQTLQKMRAAADIQPIEQPIDKEVKE